MKTHKQQVEEAVDFLKHHIKTPPVIGIMTGTGLGESIEALKVKNVFDYRKIPNIPVSTVQSHHGRLVSGTLEGLDVIAMQGRFHLYEGYSPWGVTFPVRVMQQLGVQTLILTNAAGGLNLAFNAGDIMVIEDHINLTGENPLVGANEDEWGTRFPDMTNVYDKDLAAIAEKAGRVCGENLRTGVYAGLKGPSLETSAETRFLRQIGADAVGFSTVQEAIVAVHAKMKILGLSIITNINDPDNPTPDTEEGIIEVAQQAASKLSGIIQCVAKELTEK
ncbi:MAG: purine-nucleoside phosphorylase [Desulfobacteraceae bacterium]|nr:purine-nucleoside phosphorylase [Desulfobacteraceae bacterium]MBC2754271.1 purine-nucleoside phosphorylase [Desulfobacteraceae bacterium]